MDFAGSFGSGGFGDYLADISKPIATGLLGGLVDKLVGKKAPKPTQSAPPQPTTVVPTPVVAPQDAAKSSTPVAVYVVGGIVAFVVVAGGIAYLVKG